MNNLPPIGVKAYFDSVSGLIPCKVLAHKTCDGVTQCQIEITGRLNRAYKRGEIMDVSPRWIVPRNSIITRCGQYRIRAYTWGI